MNPVTIGAVLWQIGALGQEGNGAPEQLLGLAGLSLACVGLFCALAAVKAGFIGMAVWFHVAFPRAAGRTLQMYQTRGAKCFWVGMINTVVGLFLALSMIASGALALIGLLLIAALLVLASMGYAAAYQSLGLRAAPSTVSQSQTRTVLWGGIVAELAFLVPVLGQILSLGVLFRGVGAAVLVLIAWRRNSRESAPATSPFAADSEIPAAPEKSS